MPGELLREAGAEQWDLFSVGGPSWEGGGASEGREGCGPWHGEKEGDWERDEERDRENEREGEGVREARGGRSGAGWT